MTQFKIDVSEVLENAICLIDECDYSAATVRKDGSRDYIKYSNGATDNTHSYSEERLYYGLYYGYEEKTYYLIRFNTILGPHNTLIGHNHELFASFDMRNVQLVVDEEALESIKDLGYSDWTNKNLAISKFLNIALSNHSNTIAGNKVWGLVRAHCGQLNSYTVYNLLKYYEHVQSLEKLGESFIHAIAKEEFNINVYARDRSKTLALPKQVIDYIENIDAAKKYGNYKTEYLRAFQNIMGEDPNEIIAIIDYFNVYQQVSKKIPNQAGGYWNGAASTGDDLSLIHEFGRIRLSNPDLDLRRVLNYLVKQQFMQMFYKSYGCGKGDPIRFAITIPSRLAKIFADYLAMNPTEIFAQDLYKSHNVLAKECKLSPTAEEIEMFAAYGNLLGASINKTIKDYTFVVPTDYKEFIRIGKTFMNCLPTCGKAFYSGMCDIVFIYKDGEDTPKYALELDAYRDVVQAKTIRDLDITDEEVLKAIDAYVTVLQKEMNE